VYGYIFSDKDGQQLSHSANVITIGCEGYEGDSLHVNCCLERRSCPTLYPAS